MLYPCEVVDNDIINKTPIFLCALKSASVKVSQCWTFDLFQGKRDPVEWAGRVETKTSKATADSEQGKYLLTGGIGQKLFVPKLKEICLDRTLSTWIFLTSSSDKKYSHCLLGTEFLSKFQKQYDCSNVAFFLLQLFQYLMRLIYQNDKLMNRKRWVLTLGRVIQKVDSTIHWINHYPAVIAVCFVTYPRDSDLSSGWHYPAFEQLGPGVKMKILLTVVSIISYSIK